MASQMQIGQEAQQTERAHQGGIFIIRSTIVSWYNRKQRSVALSSAEAEYMEASQAACEAI